MTLLDFTHSHVLDRRQSAEYLRVAGHPLPKGLHAMFAIGPVLAASPEPVQTRYKLEQDIASALRRELPSGRWKIVGKAKQGMKFEEIHPKYFETCDFNLASNSAGSLNQGYLLQGFEDISITTDDATLLNWKTPANKKKASVATVSFLQEYAQGDGPILTTRVLYEECIRQLQSQMSVHPGAVTFRSFQSKFAEYVPDHRKFLGAPKK